MADHMIMNIEAGHIMMFARAIGESNPIYFDEDYAAAAGVGAIIAPPTFERIWAHYEPDYPYRPQPDKPWYGSGSEPTGGPHPDTGDASGGSSFLHGEQHYTYYRHLTAGERVRVVNRPGRSWTKNGGQAGLMTFREEFVDLIGRDDAVAVTSKAIYITTEHTVAPVSGPQGRPAKTLATTPDHEEVVVSNLTRSQIQMYAGASGDFSAIHTDEVYPTQILGYPALFAHGMLTMALTGKMLTNYVGDANLQTFGVRFTKQVWPGDTLTSAVWNGSEKHNDLDQVRHLKLATFNQHGDEVLRGTASAQTPD